MVDKEAETSQAPGEQTEGIEFDGQETLGTARGTVVLTSLIIEALEKFKQGQRKEFDTYVQSLGDQSLKPAHLRRYLRALRGCTSHLTKEFDVLVGTALAVNWAGQDDETVSEFLEFLTSLVSAQTYYLRACLQMLVKLFLPKILKDTSLDMMDMEVQERRFSHVHEGLKAVLEIVPITPRFLLPILSECFPYMKKPTAFLQSYTRNLLQVMHYIPSLRENILEITVDHLTRIDVEVPKHELDQAETEHEDEDEEGDEQLTQFDVDLENQQIEQQPSEVESMEHEMADKLDILMNMVFNYIHEVCYPNGDYNVDATNELFNELLVVFEKVILPTHASCHVQFLLFYICSFDQVFSNSLFDLCWKKIDNPNTPAIIRQACAAYMASLIARAKFVDLGTTKTCLALMAHWIHDYIDSRDASSTGPSAGKHGPFYSVCQAVFYIFVFRHKQLLELEDGLKFIRKLNFERMITCRMNPLKRSEEHKWPWNHGDQPTYRRAFEYYNKDLVCLPTAVKMFATVTRMYEIVFCYTVIERNNRSLVPVASSVSGSNRAVSHLTFINQLDSFFPFDPYLLKRSSKYVTPLYQQWEGLGPENEEEHARESKQLDSEEEDEYHEYGRTPDATVPVFSPESPADVYGASGFIVSPMDHDGSPLRERHRKSKHST